MGEAGAHPSSHWARAGLHPAQCNTCCDFYSNCKKKQTKTLIKQFHHTNVGRYCRVMRSSKLQGNMHDCVSLLCFAWLFCETPSEHTATLTPWQRWMLIPSWITKKEEVFFCWWTRTSEERLARLEGSGSRDGASVLVNTGVWSNKLLINRHKAVILFLNWPLPFSLDISVHHLGTRFQKIVGR